MSQLQVLLAAGLGSAGAWFTLLITRARALAMTKAKVVVVVNVIAGLVVAFTAPDFDAASFSSMVFDLLGSTAVGLLASRETWKLWLQPSIEVGTGLPALLNERTAERGIG